MSSKQDNIDEVIPVGTLVTVDGLESETGKALNRGSGFILGAPAKEGGATRYPVLIYALASSEEEPKLVELKRSIKAKNLQEKENQKCPLYNEAVQHHVSQCFYTGNQQAALFWLSGYCERWPEDYKMTMSYANLLRSEDPKEAWNLMRQAGPQFAPNEPNINESRYDMCVTCCAARGDPEEALEWALQITTDTPEHKQLALEALTAIAEYSRDSIECHNDTDSCYGPLLRVYLSATAAMLDLAPDRAEAMINLASAECLMGNNYEGVRMYRRALATGQVPNEQEVKRDLALAMMQCPGGPMEDFVSVGTQGNKFICVPKAQAGKYVALNVGGRRMITPNSSEGVNVSLFPIPDIDDPNAFGNADLPAEE